MSAHLRHMWQLHATRTLRDLLDSWRPTGDAAQRQQQVVKHLDEVIRVLPAPPRRDRFPKHAALPTIRERKAA